MESLVQSRLPGCHAASCPGQRSLSMAAPGSWRNRDGVRAEPGWVSNPVFQVFPRRLMGFGAVFRA